MCLNHASRIAYDGVLWMSWQIYSRTSPVLRQKYAKSNYAYTVASGPCLPTAATTATSCIHVGVVVLANAVSDLVASTPPRPLGCCCDWRCAGVAPRIWPLPVLLGLSFAASPRYLLRPNSKLARHVPTF